VFHLGGTDLAAHLAPTPMPHLIGNNVVMGRSLGLKSGLIVQEHASNILLSQGYMQPDGCRLAKKHRAAWTMVFVLVI